MNDMLIIKTQGIISEFFFVMRDFLENILTQVILYDISVKIEISGRRRMMQECKLLLFDLDDTLLRSDKTISKHTLEVLEQCREIGYLIGVSTSRGETNSLLYIAELHPDVVICSGGAVVKYKDQYVYTAEFTEEETNQMIHTVWDICGSECKMTIDTLNAHFWSFRRSRDEIDASWADTIFADFSNLNERALKLCAEIFQPELAKQLAEALPDCDCIKFVDGEWYKFTQKEATKENAIKKFSEISGIPLSDVIAFGDDLPDIGMLKLCGTGVAMGNAVAEVKAAADVVIGTNDEDGIAEYLIEICLEA